MDKNKLEITPASFSEAMALQRAIGKAINKGNINVDLEGFELNKDDPLKSDVSGDTIGSVISSLISAGTSEEVEAAVFKCANRALYDYKKINIDFFEKVENRPLYYPIMIEIIKVNIGPFIGGLFSEFGGIIGLIGKNPK
jgi:hypothetical protein